MRLKTVKKIFTYEIIQLLYGLQIEYASDGKVYSLICTNISNNFIYILKYFINKLLKLCSVSSVFILHFSTKIVATNMISISYFGIFLVFQMGNIGQIYRQVKLIRKID